MDGILYMEDGTIYKGKGFGAKGTSLGELVFNTSMTGYEEILTDPSYAGQIITMTYPLIGNYGANGSDMESGKIHAKGLVVKSLCKCPSNHMSERSLEEMMKSMNVVGIEGVDTRSLTRKIRNSGSMKCVITNEELSIEEMKRLISEDKNKQNPLEHVSTKEIIHMEGKGPRVVLVDFGAKANIIENLKIRDCDITIVPYNATYEQVEEINPQGVLLSNGPGDPEDAVEGIKLAAKVMKKYPTFGICLGHQILALASGGRTYKMKYGHRGANHGVHDADRDKAFITSQNHGYAVDAESIKDKDMVVTHVNLNDNTVEGMRHKELPVFSVQFHPEGAPGPQDTSYLFDKFVKLMKNM